MFLAVAIKKTGIEGTGRGGQTAKPVCEEPPMPIIHDAKVSKWMTIKAVPLMKPNRPSRHSKRTERKQREKG